MFEEGQEEKKTTALFQKKNTKRLFFRFGQKKQKTIKSFCFFVSGKRKEAEEKRETFVYLFQEKKGLFQEQAGLLVSRTAQRIKTFVYLFQEKKGLFQEQEGLPLAACFKNRSSFLLPLFFCLFQEPLKEHNKKRCCSKKRRQQEDKVLFNKTRCSSVQEDQKQGVVQPGFVSEDNVVSC